MPLPASLETASPLNCFVKKLEPELKSSYVQANGLFITYSWDHCFWDAVSVRKKQI